MATSQVAEELADKEMSSGGLKIAVEEDLSPRSRSRLAKCSVIRRTGRIVPYNRDKIFAAVQKAFVAALHEPGSRVSGSEHGEHIEKVVGLVERALLRISFSSQTLDIEDIQDQVELALMRCEHHRIFKAYVLYREKRKEARHSRSKALMPDQYSVINSDGDRSLLEPHHILDRIETACQGLSKHINSEKLLIRVKGSLYDGISTADFDRILVLEASTLIEEDPDYSFVAARLLLDSLREEVLGKRTSHAHMAEHYARHLSEMVNNGIRLELINPELRKTFDLLQLGDAIVASRDLKFGYVGMQTLYDRYFLKFLIGGSNCPSRFL